jgi:hypothetical protein
MTLNVENLVRSGVVLAVGLPLTLSLTGVLNNLTPTADVRITTEYKSSLTEPCIRYMVSKNDSKVEREAKNEIDDIVGGETNHRETCNWVL